MCNLSEETLMSKKYVRKEKMKDKGHVESGFSFSDQKLKKWKKGVGG